MPFIGVITNQKNEHYVRENLKGIFKDDNIIFINEKNILNIKNIFFETILVDSQIKNDVQLNKIIVKSKYLILNNDLQFSKKENAITYGFNNKSTFTVSSIDEKNIIICLQTSILDIDNEEIEPQEFKMDNDENVDKYAIIGTEIVKVLYDINRHKNNKN